MKERYRNVTVTLQKIKIIFQRLRNLIIFTEKTFKRMKIVGLFNQLELWCRKKYIVVSELAQNNFGVIFYSKTTLLINVSIIVCSSRGEFCKSSEISHCNLKNLNT